MRQETKRETRDRERRETERQETEDRETEDKGRRHRERQKTERDRRQLQIQKTRLETERDRRRRKQRCRQTEVRGEVERYGGEGGGGVDSKQQKAPSQYCGRNQEQSNTSSHIASERAAMPNDTINLSYRRGRIDTVN